MKGKITIENNAPGIAVIDIEGTIGVPEKWQFEQEGQKIATYQKFSDAIETVGQNDIKEIIVNIRSTGGNVNEAILIYENLLQVKKTITTKCFGYVASAATIIAQAASAGKREISGNSLYLIHNSMCETEGNTNEMARSLSMLAKTDERLAQIYAERAGKEVRVFARLMNENNGTGRWLAPKEVIEYGLADKIIEAAPITEAHAEAISNLGLPPIPENKKSNCYKIMNIKKHWKAILNLLGLEAQDNTRITETVNNKQGEEKTGDEEYQEQIIKEYTNQIETLRNTISELEAENTRLAAKPTMTKPKEDPAVHDAKRNPNEQAYIADIKNFTE